MADKRKPQSIKQRVKWMVREFMVNRLRRANYKIYEPFRKTPRADEISRSLYQEPLISKHIKCGYNVLDIGSGHDPSPSATILSDRFFSETLHRSRPLKRDNRPLLQMDIEHIPFSGKSIDFIICSHILEHVADPVACCREIIRVGKAGYIETPTLMKDAFFCWAGKTGHRWHVQSSGRNLIFIEYSERQLQGLKTKFFHQTVFGIHEHPLLEVFASNTDFLNVQMIWQDSFNCHVFYLDGRYESLEGNKA